MNSPIYIDPEIDLQSNETAEIIIEFRIKPASLSTEKSNSDARRKVDESHCYFREELQALLENNRVAYKLMNTYTETFNGVSIKLQSDKITLLLSSNVISAIYSNREQVLPIKPIDPRYQV
ncbi:protease inhibitor I9 family protein [Virgibacillus siamensis]|uniref:protease inhibitor I9 family protein n=1 Tax=Virgibacillus siamensis TaxID=480071 RepID=UPI0009859D2B|nr:protease inhibitor I9 family protein [Virgibacillus siamensis]